MLWWNDTANTYSVSDDPNLGSSGTLTIGGNVFLDGASGDVLQMGDAHLYLLDAVTMTDSILFVSPTDNNVLIGPNFPGSTSWPNATPGTYPSLAIFSNADPDLGGDEFISFHHDGTNGQIWVGTGDLLVTDAAGNERPITSQKSTTKSANPSTTSSVIGQTGETTVVDGDVLGKIDFQAPDEADGGDAILVAGSIWAEADDTFDATTNDTDLVFATGLSETATEKMRLTSGGLLEFGNVSYGLDFMGATITPNGADPNNGITITPEGTGSVTISPGAGAFPFTVNDSGGNPILEIGDEVNQLSLHVDGDSFPTVVLDAGLTDSFILPSNGGIGFDNDTNTSELDAAFYGTGTSGEIDLGNTSSTVPNLLRIYEGNADNEPGFLVLRNDGGTEYYLGVRTDGTPVLWTGAPADDDTGGVELDAAASFDSTLVDATTWSDGLNASNIWTFDVSGTDSTLTAGNGSLTYSHDLFVQGNADVTGSLTLGELDVDFVDVLGTASQAVSAAGTARWYFDSDDNTLYLSENGGAYVEWVGGSGAFGADADTQITPSTAIVLDNDTATEIGVDLSFTANHATSGDITGLKMDITDTASAGDLDFANYTVGGVARHRLTEEGHVVQAYNTSSFQTDRGGIFFGSETGYNLSVKSGDGLMLRQTNTAELMHFNGNGVTLVTADAVGWVNDNNPVNAAETRIFNNAATAGAVALHGNGGDGTLYIYSDDTDLQSTPTNYEGGSLAADTSGNLTISSVDDGAGTGTQGDVLVNQTVYGIMSVQGGVTSQDDIGTTPIISTAWNTDGISNGCTVSSANDYITVDHAGTYDIDVSASFSGTNNATVDLHIYWYDSSGTTWTDSGFQNERTLGTGGAVGSTSLSGIVTVDTNDRFAVYISTGAATDDVTLTEAQLKIKRISN